MSFVIKMIISVVVLFGCPLLIIWARRAVPFVRRIGIIPICLTLGLILSLLPETCKQDPVETIASLALLFSIPMMVSGANVTVSGGILRSTLLSFGLVVISVVVVEFSVFLVYNCMGISNAAEMSAMAIGTYTGGTQNLLAIGEALCSGKEGGNLIACATVSDYIGSGLYLLPGMLGAERLYRKVLGDGGKRKRADKQHKSQLTEPAPRIDEQTSQINNANAIIGFDINGIGKLLIISFGLVLLGAGLEYLISGNLEGSMWIILVVSAGGLLVPRIFVHSQVKGSYECGEYLLCVFCIGMAANMDLSALAGDIVPVFLVFVISVPLCTALHVGLCKVFHIEGRLALITAIAGIYGVQYIPMLTEPDTLKRLITPGILCSACGCAVGNILGISMGTLMQML